MNFSNFPLEPSFLVSVLFGVSAVLLSLVGLIAIFVSLNSQHNIEKARELFWEMEYFFDDHVPGKEAISRFHKIYSHYLKLVKTTLPSYFIVFIAISSLSFVGISWYLFFSQFNQDSQTYKYLMLFISISIGILIAFIFLLILLTKVTIISGLPHPNKLKVINGRLRNNLNFAELAFFNSSASIAFGSNKNDPLEFVIFLPTTIKFTSSVTLDVLLWVNDQNLDVERKEYTSTERYINDIELHFGYLKQTNCITIKILDKEIIKNPQRYYYSLKFRIDKKGDIFNRIVECRYNNVKPGQSCSPNIEQTKYLNQRSKLFFELEKEKRER